jgi:hypothetical protein
MMIPETFLWPLGCLALLGAVHALFCLEDVVRYAAKRAAEALHRWL